MDYKLINEEHNAPGLKDESKTVTVTHPFHPLFGQTVKVVRLLRGESTRLIVELANGAKTTIDPSHTDFLGSPAPSTATTSRPLLDMGGLLNIVKLIKWINSGG